MLYTEFQNTKLSMLGFGTMRLPTVAGTGEIDELQVEKMTRYAIEHGVNYFDTAYPYHAGKSELVMGRVLSAYPRESYCLATKFPGHQIMERYDPKEIFEEQLQKCRVEYFDFYLLHNVCESSLDVYLDPQWGIVDYFLEQKRLGRIRHLGFSSHARPECLRAFLERYGDQMEFCQIQLNYLDWTLQEAEEKCRILSQWKIPAWVMEPLRGGKLAKLSEKETARLRALRPEESTAAWAFRWLQTVPNVTMVLSGMSDMAQMMDNVKTFSEEKPLTEGETALLAELAEAMKNAIPCTACRYCCDGCPAGLDIPFLIRAYNDLRFQSGTTVSMLMDTMPEEKRPAACLQCGECARICPQKIDIPGAMAGFAAKLRELPKWADICREREAAAKRSRIGK